MRRSVSTRLAGIALACLAAIALSSCCKSYVKASVEPCPLSNRRAMMQLIMLDGEGKNEALVKWIADDIMPYCAGIDGINE